MKEKEFQFITIKELASILRIHYMTARKLVVTGKVKAFKIGNMWFIPKKEFEKLITPTNEKNQKDEPVN